MTSAPGFSGAEDRVVVLGPGREDIVHRNVVPDADGGSRGCGRAAAASGWRRRCATAGRRRARAASGARSARWSSRPRPSRTARRRSGRNGPAGRKPSRARPEEIGSLAWQMSLPVALRQAARLVHQLGVRVDLVEHVAAGREKVELVRRHQRAQRQRVGSRGRPPPRDSARGRSCGTKSMPRIATSPSPRCFAHSGKTFMIDDFAVVTPMK